MKFVVQKHYASHIHYDFRLEMNGVLKSWAIPKGIPTQPKIKRLAVSVEDHNLEHISFEGEIPEGLYGAGKVIIWDKGTYTLIKKEKNELVFDLNGKKLKGRYALIHMKNKNWLLFKLK